MYIYLIKKKIIRGKAEFYMPDYTNNKYYTHVYKKISNREESLEILARLVAECHTLLFGLYKFETDDDNDLIALMCSKLDVTVNEEEYKQKKLQWAKQWVEKYTRFSVDGRNAYMILSPNKLKFARNLLAMFDDGTWELPDSKIRAVNNVGNGSEWREKWTKI